MKRAQFAKTFGEVLPRMLEEWKDMYIYTHTYIYIYQASAIIPSHLRKVALWAH